MTDAKTAVVAVGGCVIAYRSARWLHRCWTDLRNLLELSEEIEAHAKSVDKDWLW